MRTLALRRLAQPVPSPLLAALAAAGLVACGGGGGSDGGSSTPALTTAEQQAQDVAKAKAMFQLIRDNESALNPASTSSGNTTPGVARAVEAFGTSVQTDAVSLATAVTDSVRLDQMAFALWQDYKAGVNTSGTSSSGATLSGCTVYQGAFPGTALGRQDGQPFTPTSVAATSAANAAWVGCSKNSAALLPRYRQTKLYDMAGAIAAGTYPASVAYTAITRSQPTSTTIVNLTRAFEGRTGFAGTVAAPTGFTLKGDLPPLTGAGGTLLADRYYADVGGSLTTLASGSRQVTLTGAGFKDYAPAAAAGATPALRLDVNLNDTAAGTTTVVAPPDDVAPTAQQLADARASLYATVSGPNGSMAGSVVANTFAYDAGTLFPKSVKFTGTLSALPAGASAQTQVLSGTLDYVNGSNTVASPQRTVVFSGRLTLPQQPEATLAVTLADTSATSQHFKVDYARNGATLAAEGDRTPNVTTATITNANGVKTVISSTAAEWPITVDGRSAGRVVKDTLRIVYVNGDTESLPSSVP